MPPQLDTTDEMASFFTAVATALGIGATAAISVVVAVISALVIGYRKIAPLLKEVRDNSQINAAAASHLVHETSHNSGSSMKDALARIESKISVIEIDLNRIKKEFYYEQESQADTPPF